MQANEKTKNVEGTRVNFSESSEKKTEKILEESTNNSENSDNTQTPEVTKTDALTDIAIKELVKQDKEENSDI